MFKLLATHAHINTPNDTQSCQHITRKEKKATTQKTKNLQESS